MAITTSCSCVHRRQVVSKWLHNVSEYKPTLLSKAAVPPSFLQGGFESRAVSRVKSLCGCLCQQSFTNICAGVREGVVPGAGMTFWKQKEGMGALRFTGLVELNCVTLHARGWAGVVWYYLKVKTVSGWMVPPLSLTLVLVQPFQETA